MRALRDALSDALDDVLSDALNARGPAGLSGAGLQPGHAKAGGAARILSSSPEGIHAIRPAEGGGGGPMGLAPVVPAMDATGCQ
jgi:hypothetical protein